MIDPLAPGEVVDEDGSPPDGFTLAAEQSRTDPIAPGIVTRDLAPEPDDEEVDAIAPDDADDADGAEDDDAIDDPDDDVGPIEDEV